MVPKENQECAIWKEMDKKVYLEKESGQLYEMLLICHKEWKLGVKTPFGDIDKNRNQKTNQKVWDPLNTFCISQFKRSLKERK